MKIKRINEEANTSKKNSWSGNLTPDDFYVSLNELTDYYLNLVSGNKWDGFVRETEDILFTQLSGIVPKCEKGEANDSRTSFDSFVDARGKIRVSVNYAQPELVEQCCQSISNVTGQTLSKILSSIHNEAKKSALEVISTNAGTMIRFMCSPSRTFSDTFDFNIDIWWNNK